VLELLLLEANIEYTDKFKDILRSIDLLVDRTLHYKVKKLI
jgi:hypothetical protein